ncbi:MAG: hypothetical protein N3G21_03015 [Candidatus Hydrogenedentes bacterium]|nr:hypothetical protein [Candidatus Hydrogenedentota bacterium]
MLLRYVICIASMVIVLGNLNVSGDSDFPLHGRISYDSGTLIKGLQDDDWSRASLNTLVLEGDTIWADKGSNTEIELPNGTFLRMADASKAKILQLSPDIVVQGIVGSFYIERVVRSSGRVEFVTPACRISFDPETFTRIDIGEGGATQVTTRWGRAYITTERGGNEVVAGGKRCWVDVGYLPSETVSFAIDQMDAFDRWSKSRSELIAEPVRTPPKHLEVRSTTIGYVDLSHYGEWVLIEERYYWRPTVVIDYVPYRLGYWTYVPAIGSVWIETYPFGYITTHYGRWVYYETYGWVWGFDPVWSPAWVATVRCGDYFIWTPVDFYCRPVRVSASVCFAIGGLNFYIGACSYVPVSYVYTCPWYVAPLPVTVVNYVVNNPVNIYVWNIDCRPRPVINVPYSTSMPLVRDYNPPRAIRGVPYYDYARARGGVLASSRVNELESNYTVRTSTGGFRSSRDITPRLSRTPMGEDVLSRFRSVRVTNTSPKPEIVRFERFQGGVDRDIERGREGGTTRSGTGMERFSVDTAYTRAIERSGNNIRRGSIPDSINPLERRNEIRTDTINTLRRESVSGNVEGRTTNRSTNSIRDGIGESLVRRSEVRTTHPLSETSRIDMRGSGSIRDSIRTSGNEPVPVRTPIRERGIPSLNMSRIDMDGEQKPRDSGSTDRGPYDIRRPGGDGGSPGGGPSIRTTPSPRPNTPPQGTTPPPYPGDRGRTTPRSELFDNSPSLRGGIAPLNTARENHSIRTIPSYPSNRVEPIPNIPSRGHIGGFTPFDSPSSSIPPASPVGRGSISKPDFPSPRSLGRVETEPPRFTSPRIETPSFATPSAPVGRPSIPSGSSFSRGNSMSSGIRGRMR